MTIAPVLLEIVKRCEDRGMPFLAMVGYDDEGSVARTCVFLANAPATIRYADAIGQAWLKGGVVNIDAFLLAVTRDACEKGHSSMMLEKLGVPLKPASTPGFLAK
jgi:hypothetical protein